MIINDTKDRNANSILTIKAPPLTVIQCLQNEGYNRIN